MLLSKRYLLMAKFERKFTTDPNSYIVCHYESMAAYHIKFEEQT